MKNNTEKLFITADTILSPSEIREYRLFLKITQEQAAKICGGGPNAFSRYESGKVRPSKATCNLLRLLSRHPEETSTLLGGGTLSHKFKLLHEIENE
jgi:putative zinc finger/helix-turn-helix YgiT family protein